MRAYRLAYDGREYHGFQRQPDVATIEDALFTACETLGVWTGDTPPGYTAAGRTDARVSALAQTVGIDGPGWLEPQALNAELPDAIRVWAIADTGPDFHATADATTRAYTYYLHAPKASLDRAETLVATLSGTHDFHNLTPADTGTERTLDAAVHREGPFLVLKVESAGFVHELVRRIATLVDRVATGAADPSFVDRVLDSKPLQGPAGIGPAPGDGLLLTQVTYPSLTFEVDQSTVQAVEQLFRERAATAATHTQVFEAIGDGLTELPRD